MTPLSPSLAAQVNRLERARTARGQRDPFVDDRVTLSHGSGGKASRRLIDGLIVPTLGAAGVPGNADSAVFAVEEAATGRLALTTDSYVVSPLFFPGGDIGTLAVHGTINDLAMAGAQPVCLAIAFILEEGLETSVLRAVVESVGAAAQAAGVVIATGDTKVVPRGKADRMFITTSGVGLVRAGLSLCATRVRAGDRVLISGPIGDHGIAVMLARDALDIEADICSDSAPLHRLVGDLLHAAPTTRVLKDPTRGGVATSLNEIARLTGVAIQIDERSIPVRPDVRAACEMLGLDPLHIANEGKLIAIVPPHEAELALEAMRSSAVGRDAALIGEVLDGPGDLVLLKTEAGGTRVLDMLTGDPLPRIC